MLIACVVTLHTSNKEVNLNAEYNKFNSRVLYNRDKGMLRMIKIIILAFAVFNFNCNYILLAKFDEVL